MNAMRAVIQRVSRAEVRVAGQVTGAIGAGAVVLLGVETGDSETDAQYLAAKIAGLRIWEDEAGKMNRSLAQMQGAALVISQFTLLGDIRRGLRPAFERAAPAEAAQPLYEYFLGRLRADGVAVQCGVFRAHMEVELINDGPVTILLDSRKEF